MKTFVFLTNDNRRMTFNDIDEASARRYATYQGFNIVELVEVREIQNVRGDNRVINK